MLSSINSRRSPSFFHDSTVNQISPLPSLTIPPSRYPMAADAFLSHYTPQSAVRSSPRSDSSTNDQGIHCSNPHPQPKVEEQSYISPQSESFSTYPLYNWSYKQHQLLSIPAPTTVPPLSYYYRPRRLDEIAPRETIFLIIALFFDFVYPLTPCIHKQSFMADLHSRREERDPLFFALVMSTLSSTLVQLPRSYLPMDRPVVRKLAQVCSCASLMSILLNLRLECSRSKSTHYHCLLRSANINACCYSILVSRYFSRLIPNSQVFFFAAILSIIFVRAMTLHNMLHSVRLSTLP